MEADMQNDVSNPSDLCRPAKRRKFYRKRNDLEDEEVPKAESHSSIALPEPMTVDELVAWDGFNTLQENAEGESDLSIADILRQRKAAARRKGGIEFTKNDLSNCTTPQPRGALAVKDDETPALIKSVVERFAPQTGQVTDTTDKHMYAFPTISPSNRLTQRLTY